MKTTIINAIKNSPFDFIYRRIKRHRLRSHECELPQYVIHFFTEFLGSNDLVFDVGANHGSMAKVFRQLNTRVVAFEPQESCYDYLKSYFWGDKNVYLENVALGGNPGVANMRTSKDSLLSTLSPDFIQRNVSSGRFASEAWSGEQKVVVETLDKFISKYGTPQFIKIDVEGFEAEVVRGLTKPVKMLSLEFSTDTTNTLIDALGYLSSIGKYQFQFSAEEKFYLDPMAWIDLRGIEIQLRGYTGLEWGDVYCRENIL